jgi:hypothetical protein
MGSKIIVLHANWAQGVQSDQALQCLQQEGNNEAIKL